MQANKSPIYLKRFICQSDALRNKHIMLLLYKTDRKLDVLSKISLDSKFRAAQRSLSSSVLLYQFK